ncbi:MAG: Gfo/Idh/MocA family protein [Acidobacteriota bacterium]
MKTIGRRQFLGGSLGAAPMIAASSSKRAVSPNDKVTLGVMGIGGRGTRLTERLAARSDVTIAYLCDVDGSRFERAVEVVGSTSGDDPKLVKDFRRILDDRQVDALIIATPNQWHALGTIMACQAGKDVYVEKPASNNVWEGRKMVEASRKYERVVQVGMQCRSAPYFGKAVKYLRSGKLGDIRFVRVLNMIQDRERPRGPEQHPPKSLDWDFWCGPARKRPYSSGRWWMNFWDYSSGKITDDAVHQIDLARSLIDRPYPETVSHAGGVFAYHDGREIPDTQFVTHGYPGGLTLILQGTLWAHYMKKTAHSIRDSDQFPDWQFNSTKIEVFGTNGMMIFGRHGGGWLVYDAEGKLAASHYGRQSTDEHLENFIECVRTRKKPNADIEEGHRSALLCHLGNISYRAGNRKLRFDPKTETFANDEEANRYLKHKYRSQWALPDEV